jgi:hypothetical protein
MTRTARTLTLVCALAASARAQAPGDAKASALFDDGKRHFDIAEYTAAIASWKQAYLLSNEPLLLFNIGQAYRLAGNCAEANRFYLNYQRVVPKPANAVELDAAMAKCAGVEPATGESEAPPVDTKPVETKPIETTPPPPIVPPKPVPLTRTVDEGGGLRTSGLVIGGVGAAAGAAALVFAFEASSKASTVSGQNKGTPWSGALVDDQSAGKTDQTLSRVLGGVGIAAIAAGGTLWWLGHSRANTTHVDVAVVPGRTEVTLTCAF